MKRTVILNCTVSGYLRKGHYELNLNDERWEKFNSLDKEDQIRYIRNWGNMVIDDWLLDECWPNNDLTDNKDELIKFVKNARNTCGGDGDEFYKLVIKKIVEETSWREGSTKSVLLIADAYPHEVGYSYRASISESYIIENNQIDWREEAKKAKKSMAVAYKEALEFIQNNPVKDYIEGENRILRGYKMQFVSRDGKYRCMDMDITRTDKETGERLVNINTISQLIYNGTKYIVN